MYTYYARLIEIALGPLVDEHTLAVIADQPTNQSKDRNVAFSFSFPKTSLPNGSNVIVTPTTDSFPTNLQQLLNKKKPKRLFLAPPFLHYRFVPERIRARYPRLNYEVIALQTALRSLPDGATVAAIMPASFFQGESNRSVRFRLFDQYRPKLLITHTHSVTNVKSQAEYDLGLKFGLPMHGNLQFNTVVVGVGSADRSIRFFKCMKASDVRPLEEELADLSRLLKQGGGKTKYGYIIREGLPADVPLIHELYDPVFISKQQSISAIGEIKQLSDLADIRQGISFSQHSQLPLASNTGQRVGIIEGNDISTEGRINHNDFAYRVKVLPKLLLRKGDLCVGSIFREKVRIGEVTEDLLPAIARNTVLVLRFKPGLSVEARQTIFAYLRSAHAAEQLQIRALNLGATYRVTLSGLAGLPVPILDEDLSTAVKDINKSIYDLHVWAEEAERQRDALFEFTNPKKETLEIKKLGRLSRQRCDAARLVNDQQHRIRTQFPYPIAFRWRTVDASHPDMEGYLNVLECAEVAVCYLACMALLLPGLLPEFQIRYVNEIKKRLSETEHGTSMGDWVAIVRETKNAKSIRKQLENVPFGELAAFDDETDQALQRLHKARNDQAHQRGPKGAEIRNAFEMCRTDLEVFLEGIEFLTEYPLRLIERAKRDTLMNLTKYEHRDLMGDHPLVPVQISETKQTDLEESLYLVDRGGTLHLIRPFLNRIECPECGRWSLFYLDSYSKRDNRCSLKSMDHGHSANADGSIIAALRHIGFLPG